MKVYVVIRNDDDRIDESGAFVVRPKSLGVFKNKSDALSVKNKEKLNVLDEYETTEKEAINSSEFNYRDDENEFYLDLEYDGYYYATRITILEEELK